MRVVSAVLFASVLTATLGACNSAHARKPAWPKQTEREVDGGESLAPRSATAVAARDTDAVDDAADDDAVVTPKSTPTTTPPTDAKPTPSTPTTVIEDLVITEEIVIEIDD